MKTQHTRGPWLPETKLSVVYGLAPRFIIASTFEPDAEEHDNAVANAKLIAAAPDLLAALQLDSMFPATTVVGQQAIEAYSRYLGWKEDMPLENFAQFYRNAVIKKATT